MRPNSESGPIRAAIRRRRGGFRLISQTGARVVVPQRLDAKTRARASIPSALTLLNMLCGFTSILMSVQHRFDVAAILIAVAVGLDIGDGAVARAVGAITPFGLQLDSLADLISFGIAPAILVYFWGVEPIGNIGWAVSGLWLICAAIRLARFNVTIDPLADKRYFIGLPSPGAAGVVLASVFAFDPPFDDLRRMIPFAACLIPALLMVTSYRFMSFRNLVSPKKNGIWLSIAFVVLLVTGLILIPQITGLLVAYGYVLVAPLGAITAPIRRRLLGPDSVAPPRHRLPSVLIPIDEHEDEDENDDE